MCGRFTRSKDFFSQHADQRAFLDQLGLSFADPLPPSYNIAPTQQIAAVRADEHDRHALVMLRWGLVPGWAPDLAIGAKMINARGARRRILTAVAKLSAREAAKRTGRTISGVNRKMSEAHKRRGTRPPAAGRAWTAEDDAFVERLPATEAAKRSGRTISAVRNRRRKLGLTDGRRRAAKG